MKRENQNFLKEVFYKYWMKRVPKLDEFEAIDHLEWELRNLSLIPDLGKEGTISKETKKELRVFIKEKKIK